MTVSESATQPVGVLRKCRQGRGLSLYEEAKLSGLSPSYISQIERGIRRPSLAAIAALAPVLRMGEKELKALLAEYR